jgi:hypothetical protein
MRDGIGRWLGKTKACFVDALRKSNPEKLACRIDLEII